MKHSLKILVVTLGILAGTLAAQDQSTGQKEPTGVPVLTGYTGFVTKFEPGEQQMAPTFAPIVLIPIGQKWLIEAEGEFEGEYTHHTGEPWERKWEKGVEYLQVDYIANKHLTIVAGRFLTPFGIFNERLHPLWIKNLQQTPLIFPIATGSGNGIMLRGGARLSPDVNLNYSAYFSAASTVRAFEATRTAGGRVSLFFPNQRLEIGTSFQRQLQDERFNSYGLDFTWQAKALPLEFRGEYAHSKEMGSGYWIESAYRLRKVPFARPFFRKSQAVLRMDQFFVPAMAGGGGGMGGHGEELPDVNTQRFTAGWNYYVREGLKLSFSGGRAFSADGDRNVFTVGIAYRFFFPLGGKQK